MDLPDRSKKPNTQMAPHGYNKDSNTLGIRFSRVNLGLTHERIGKDLQILRSKRGTIGGIVIYNAAEKLHGIVDLNPKEDPEEVKQKEIEDRAISEAFRTIQAVEHYFPGAVGAARILLTTDIEKIQEELPDATANWRQKFPGTVEELTENLHFRGWLNTLNATERDKILTRFAEEAWEEVTLPDKITKKLLEDVNLEGLD